MGAVGFDSDLLELPLLLAELSVHPGDDFLEVRPLLRRGLLLLGQALLHGCKTQRCDFTRRPPGNLSLDLFEQKCTRVRDREKEKGTSELLVSAPRPLLQALSRVLVSALHPRRELAEPRGELLHLLHDRCERPE